MLAVARAELHQVAHLVHVRRLVGSLAVVVCRLAVCGATAVPVGAQAGPAASRGPEEAAGSLCWSPCAVKPKKTNVVLNFALGLIKDKVWAQRLDG